MVQAKKMNPHVFHYHTLILGRTGSGKSVLAKTLAKEMRAKKNRILVLDPYVSDDWDCDYITNDPMKFLNVAKKNKFCKLFIDESYRTVGRFNAMDLQREMAYVTIESRHDHHQAFIIAQSPVQVDTTTRDGCERYYLFRMGPRFLKEISEKTGEPSVMVASQLGQFEFLKYEPWQTPQRGKIDVVRKRIYDLKPVDSGGVSG
jgi:energy-coupling factor transporter ATP-binding protein EcfA2